MTQSKQPRTQHSEEFKTETLKLAKQVGVTQAASRLGIHPSQIYQWPRCGG